MKSEQLLKKNLKYKLLILGGDGYIAQHLKNHLEEYFIVKCISSKDVNYHDKRTLWRYLCIDFSPTHVINCSGFTGRPNIDEAENKKDVCWKLNVTSPLMVASICDRLAIRYIHVGSGCIYSGYDKNYTEEDTPDFGLWSDESSFYSKTKHAFELVTEHIPVKHVRIRMPLSSIQDERSYLSKIKKYNNLIDYRNSKTYVKDLCGFIQALIKDSKINWFVNEKFNVVNPDPLYTSEICGMMNKHGMGNDNWNYVPMDEIPIKAGRSNCVLNGTKVNKIYQMRTEEEAIEEILNETDNQ